MRTRLTRQAGAAFRRHRLARGWTLQQLSDKCGMPLSTLSKVELGQASLTYDKILRLCRALEIDPGLSILQDAGPTIPASARRAVIRAGEGQAFAFDSNVAMAGAQELLSKSFTPLVLTLQSGEEAQPHRTVNGEAYLYVLSGAAILRTYVYAPLHLGAGDAVFFDGSIEHAIEAANGAPATALLIVSGDEGFWRDSDNDS